MAVGIETPLEMAARHVRQNAERVSRHVEMVVTLRERGVDASSAVRTLEILIGAQLRYEAVLADMLQDP